MTPHVQRTGIGERLSHRECLRWSRQTCALLLLLGFLSSCIAPATTHPPEPGQGVVERSNDGDEETAGESSSSLDSSATPDQSQLPNFAAQANDALTEDHWPAPLLTPPEPDLELQISHFVRRIFQDKSGHFWLGTNGDGVCRYDGKSLEYYSIDKGFGGVAVRAIVEDSAGNLWFGTSGGVTRYDGETFVNFTEEDGLNSDDVWCLCVDRAGTLWVGTYGGACRFQADSKRFTPFSLPPAPSLDPLRGVASLHIVHCIMQDEDGNMWFSGGTGGVHKYDGESLTEISIEDGLCGNSVTCMLEDKRGDIWFSTFHNGVCRFDGSSFTHVSKTEGLSGTEVWSLYEDTSGNIWFPSEGFGVYRYDGQSFTNFSKDAGLASHAIQCTFEDRDGRLWFGGWLGLYRFDGTSFVNVTRYGPWN